MLPPGAASMLRGCRTWRTIAGHAESIAAHAVADAGFLDAASVGEVRGFLQEMADHGLLVGRREAARFLPAMPNAPRPIETLAIVTCDRPNLLNRCVRSFAQNVKSSGRSVEFIVSDDSRDQANQLANRESLLTIVREFGLSIRYAAKRGRGAFSDSLAREAGVDPEIARFGFSGSGGAQQAAFGANRNAMLMECAGEPFLTSDDDVVCRLSAAPDAREPVTFCRGEDPIEFWFHPSQDEALAAWPAADEDVFELHERYLGRTGWDCAARAANEWNMTAPAAELTHFGPKSVIATYSGILGDNAYTKPAIYLLLRGASRVRLHTSEQAYRDAYKGRQVLRVARRPVVGSLPGTTTLAGFDARMLPPFVPVFRNEDALFGALVRRAMPDCSFAQIPFAIQHAPWPPRTHSDDGVIWCRPECVTFASLLSACLECGPAIHAGVPAPEGLTAVGRHLRSLGALSNEDFRRAVLPVLLNMMAAFIALTGELLVLHEGEPAYWAQDLVRHRDQVIGNAQSPEFCVPRELVNEGPPEEALARARSLVRRFGAFLEAWPALYECGCELRRREVRLSRPVHQSAPA